MPTQTRKRRRLDPQVRRREIIEAAERLLKRDGAKVRVEDIVREAQAAKGTFYLYFPVWDDLLASIRGRLIEAFDRAHPVPDPATADIDWPRLVEQQAVAFVVEVAAMGGLHEVLFHTDFARRRPVEARDDPVRRLAGIIAAGREAGAFAAVDALPTARLMFAVIHETADAVEAGEDRDRALAAMCFVLKRALEPAS